jgi:hypothetical protein
MKELTEITEAVLNDGIKVTLQNWGSWEGTFSAPFDNTTDHPVYATYYRVKHESLPVGPSKIHSFMVPTGATFTTPIGTIHITESNDIEHLDIIGDERPPEVVAAEMIKNIYLAHFAPEHLPESWRADHMATEARRRESIEEKQAIRSALMSRHTPLDKAKAKESKDSEREMLMDWHRKWGLDVVPLRLSVEQKEKR